MEDIITKYLLQFGGFGILTLYLFLENKRKDAKITKLEELLEKKENAYNTRIDAYIEKSLEVFEAFNFRKEAQSHENP